MYYLLLREEEKSSHGSKVFDIAFWDGETPAPALARFWGRQIRLLQSPMPGLFSRILLVVSWYWLRDPRMSRHVVDFTRPEQYRSARLNSTTYSASRFLTESESRDTTDCLKNLGIAADQPIALVHVRDASYDLQFDSTYDGHWSNANKESFQPAVDLLLTLGYAVLTVGNERSSPSGLRGAIEYHASSERNPLRDFTLASAAALYIGTASGAPSGAAINFRLPLLLTNSVVPNWQISPEVIEYGRAVVIPKNVESMGKLWNLRECLSREFPESDRMLRSRGIALWDNDADDLVNGLKELLALVSGKLSWESTRNTLDQKTFYEIVDLGIRLPRLALGERPVISPSFLKKYPHWIRDDQGVES
jgi:putative glycosyltransferase (TIGR04372 family)